MKYPYESVVINEDVPMFALLTSVKYVSMHWHDRIEFILVLRGNVHIFVEREEYFLQENDLLLINSNDVHGLESSEDNRLLVLQIPISFIKKCYNNIEREVFQCQSFLHKDQGRFNEIRSLLAELLLTLGKKDFGFDIKIHSLLLDVIHSLLNKFRVENNTEIHRKSRKDIDRMTRITSYIHEHYMHPITLNEIAENEQLTVPYLSRYIQQHIGQSFVKYLNGVRLEQAVRYLLETDWPVIQIAIESGFANLNTFHKLFKETFHTTPYQYRKKHQKSSIYINHTEKAVIESYDFKKQEDMSDLHKYLTFSEKDKN
jgi:AraC-like DNA-binding protein